MSAYNEEANIKFALNSIVRQNYRNFEVVIANDGSTDNTYKILKNYKSKLDLKILNFKKNLGFTQALQQTVRYTSGDYILRLDADDQYLPHYLFKLKNFIKNNNNPEMICFGATSINDESIINLPNKEIIKRFTFGKKFKNLIFFRNINIHGTFCIKRSLLLKLGYRKKFKFAQDYDLFLRAYNETSAVMCSFDINEYLLFKNQSSISSKNYIKQAYYAFFASINGIYFSKKIKFFLKIRYYSMALIWFTLTLLKSLFK